MRQQQVLLTQVGHGLLDLLVCGHAGREDDGTAGGAHLPQEGHIGQRGGGNLKHRRGKLLDEIHRLLVPAGSKPQDALFFAVAVHLLVFLGPEFHLAAVFQVGDDAPRGLAHHVAIFGRDGFFRGALLKFHRIATGHDGHIDQAFCDVQVAVVVDPDLGGDEHRRAGTDDLISNLNRFRHKHSFGCLLVIRQADGCISHVSDGFLGPRNGKLYLYNSQVYSKGLGS